ncbi:MULTISPECIES: TatD family hydrolase [Salimicrobium]|uniref:Hydrolase TatD n=3 Tax=Salimicrobium TaxID=351195 RepID=K2G6Z9_9BACI|nr:MULTISPECIES: TatD family hydrolase [Salimicrobium]AKG03274.1 hydrolase TatD [Salimicrobium jeotgali]EKE30978.1 TatD family deoxyribonuclease [Salimicrobium jeotgali]MBM7697510.1 TatD DNase family protein [Salimicrobium jeotgali]SDY35797.1 TatD DNase family protein [Salimicrobium album]SIS97047.1 TatD DNase family protein [Salimicrobium salexigens]
MLFDTHVHLNADQFEEDRDETIRRAREAGVEYMTVVGFDRKTIPKALEIAESDENIYAAVGWHPVDAVDMTEEDLEWIESLADHPKVVAIGEMGLDYHWDKSPEDVQKEVFKKQIALAKRVNLPIIIHNREATEDIIEVLEQENAEDVGGIMHCYNGPVEYAERAIDMNFMISLGGPVTFKNATLPKEVAKAVDMKHLLVETDAPFLAPHPNRGKRNEPAWVKLVAEQIAELKELSYEEVAETTTENAKKFFGIQS